MASESSRTVLDLERAMRDELGRAAREIMDDELGRATERARERLREVAGALVLGVALEFRPYENETRVVVEVRKDR